MKKLEKIKALDIFVGVKEETLKKIAEKGKISDIEKGKVVVLLDKYSENRATTEPNTIGPDGVRNPETEQKAESLGERPMINDHELTTDELEDYEKKY